MAVKFQILSQSTRLRLIDMGRAQGKFEKILRRVCKIANLNYHFRKLTGMHDVDMLFQVWHKVRFDKDVLRYAIAASSLYCVPSSANTKEEKCKHILFKTSFLENAFGHLISSYEQLCIELDLMS